MTGRVPLADDGAAIAKRLAEIQAERMQAIAGCGCPPADMLGGITHRPNCPFGPQPVMPSQMELAREAMQRARARARVGPQPRLCLPAPKTAAEHYAEGVAAKYARHRVLS